MQLAGNQAGASVSAPTTSAPAVAEVPGASSEPGSPTPPLLLILAKIYSEYPREKRYWNMMFIPYVDGDFFAKKKIKKLVRCAMDAYSRH